jgi:Protein of unknown function (DUF3108)
MRLGRTTLLLTLVGLAESAAAAHPGARPGEAFTFKFSLGPVEGGRARMSVGRPVAQGQKRVLAVHGEAETTAFIKLLAKVSDDYQLVVDMASLLPLSVNEQERGVRERHVLVTMDGRNVEMDVSSPTRNVKGKRVLPMVARDPLSGFFALRALPLTDGQQIGLDVLDGSALWRVKLDVKRGQKVKVHLGSDGEGPARAAIRIDGVATRIDDAGKPRPVPPRKLTIYLGDDRDRPLLRLEADTDLGRCALELTSYLPPARVGSDKAPELPGVETH